MSLNEDQIGQAVAWGSVDEAIVSVLEPCRSVELLTSDALIEGFQNSWASQPWFAPALSHAIDHLAHLLDAASISDCLSAALPWNGARREIGEHVDSVRTQLQATILNVSHESGDPRQHVQDMLGDLELANERLESASSVSAQAVSEILNATYDRFTADPSIPEVAPVAEMYGKVLARRSHHEHKHFYPDIESLRQWCQLPPVHPNCPRTHI